MTVSPTNDDDDDVPKMSTIVRGLDSINSTDKYFL